MITKRATKRDVSSLFYYIKNRYYQFYSVFNTLFINSCLFTIKRK